VTHVKEKSNIKEDQMDTTELPVTMTVEEAWQAIGGKKAVSKQTFYTAVHRGQIPALKLGKRRILIPRTSFMRWLESGSAPTAA
jgi:excisionase family DNA binding protein